MSVPPQQGAGAREVVIAVGAVAGIVVLLGWLTASHNALPARPPSSPAGPQSSGPPRELDNPAIAAVHADALARQSGGELSKLSDLDQRWLDASTAGHAQEFLTARAKALKAKKPKPKHGARPAAGGIHK